LSAGLGAHSIGIARPWCLGLTVAGVLTGWGAAVAGVAHVGVLWGRVDAAAAIALPLSWLLPMIGIIWALRRFPRVRAALGSRSGMARLASTQVARSLGVVFLVLHSRHELPGVFAYPAAWGDVAVGVTAPVVSWAIWFRYTEVLRRGSRWRAAVIGWNVFGFCEHVVAVFLGSASFPGPLQLFHQQPTTAIFAALPLLLFPAYLVCFADTLHLFLLDVILHRTPETAGTRAAARVPGADRTVGVAR
jgi:hypothetical protein